jgi:pyruvate,water dikinase
LLTELRRTDIDLAGGKAANLGELTAASFPIPPGFVLTTAAYDEFVTTSGISADIITLASLVADAEPSAYERAEEKIRTLFASHDLPAVLAAEAIAAYRRLGEEAVASAYAANRRCSSQSRAAGRRCGLPGRWPTGHGAASTRPRCAWQSSCRRWSRPTPRA